MGWSSTGGRCCVSLLDLRLDEVAYAYRDFFYRCTMFACLASVVMGVQLRSEPKYEGRVR